MIIDGDERLVKLIRARLCPGIRAVQICSKGQIIDGMKCLYSGVYIDHNGSIMAQQAVEKAVRAWRVSRESVLKRIKAVVNSR